MSRKVWVRFAVPVMVLVDEHGGELERVVMLAGEKVADRDLATGHFLFYDEDLEQIGCDEQRCSHALYVADHERWPDQSEWERMDEFGWMIEDAWEQANPACPDCDADGYLPADDPDEDGVLCERCAGNGIIDRSLGRHADAPDRPEWAPSPSPVDDGF